MSMYYRNHYNKKKKKEHRSGLPFPTAGDLPDPGIKTAPPVSPALPADSLPTEVLGKHLYRDADTLIHFYKLPHLKPFSSLLDDLIE